MAKFLFVYRRSAEAAAKMTPETMEQMLERWRVWMAEGLQKGWLLDIGDGLKPEGKIVRQAKVVTDGPFVESKEVVGGFSIIQAETLAAATEIAHGCPVLQRGGCVEVRELAGFTVGK